MNTTPLFLDYAIATLDYREKHGVRGIVSERNRFAVHVRKAPFATMPLGEIRRRHVRSWLSEMQEKLAADTRGVRKISTQTVHRSLALVSAVFGRALDEDILEANPCHLIKLHKREDEIGAKEPWTYLTPNEQHAFITCNAIRPEHRIAIRFAIGTGLRQGEQSHLELADVRVDGPTPHVMVRYGSFKKGKRLPPKNGKTRKVPLFGDGLLSTREAIAFVADKPNPDGLLFPTPRGRRRGVGKPLGRCKGDSGWDCAWKFAKRSVGIERRLRWHDLRHTCASNLVSGVLGRRWTLEEIQPLMGHSTIAMTGRYAHLGEGALYAAARDTSFIPPPPDTERVIEIPAECMPEMFSVDVPLECMPERSTARELDPLDDDEDVADAVA